MEMVALICTDIAVIANLGVPKDGDIFCSAELYCHIKL